jgi:hypothetical protein
VSPAPGGPGDPTTAGATLRVYNAAGSGELVTVTLPATGWTVAGSGYRFRAPSGPITAVRVKADRIAIRGRGASWGYTLDEASQGRVALRLRLGTASAWCAEAGEPPRAPRIDTVDRFVAQPRTLPPTVCPAVP